MFTALLSFGVPLLLSHLGVSLALPGLAGVIGGRAAAAILPRVLSKGASSAVHAVLSHVHQGGEVTPEHRELLASHAAELFAPPKFEPGKEGPAVWGIPRG